MPKLTKIGILVTIVAALYGSVFIVNEVVQKETKPLIDRMGADASCAQPYLDKQYVEALEPCRRSADVGNAMSQMILGEMYYYGRGVKKDSGAAFDYARAAADKERNAKFLLGLIFLERNKSPDDIVQARKWLADAASKCHLAAPMSLAGSFVRGDEKDVLSSYVWVRLSTGLAAHDPEYAEIIERRRIELENALTPDQIAEAKQTALTIKATFEPACR